MSGPKENLSKGWRLIRTDIQMEEPQRLDASGVHVLGCRQTFGTLKLPAGKEVTTMTYDMEEFLATCVTSYLDLAGLPADKLKAVPTPFLPADHTLSPAGRPFPKRNLEAPTLARSRPQKV